MYSIKSLCFIESQKNVIFKCKKNYNDGVVHQQRYFRYTVYYVVGVG